MIRFFTCALVLLFAFTGCDKAEPVTYKIPKEDREVAQPEPMQESPRMPQPADSSKMQVLPGMQEAAQAAPELAYTVPESWDEFPPQSVRKANFRISGEGGGKAEVAVTVFPGDVGGLLANINRWRGQIGLDPIDADGITQISRPITISQHKGTLVDLQGPEQSILGGILSFHGSTWFFKMQGATGTVAGQAEAMEAFLSSIKIEDDHH